MQSHADEELIMAGKVNPAAACFFNGLLRETVAWRQVRVDEVDVVLLPLAQGELHLKLRHRSVTGECRFQWPIVWRYEGLSQPVSFEVALEKILLTPALVGDLSQVEREVFGNKVLESHANTLASMASRDDLEYLQHGPLTFSEAEQGLLAGHAFHPAPKSRAPFSQLEAYTYCPEHRASFGLGWWAVNPEILVMNSSRESSAAELARRLLPEDYATAMPAGFAALPMHPWQALHLQQQASTRSLEAKGLLCWLGFGPSAWRPTSSHRSLYAPQVPWMVKGSLSVRLTNSLRTLSVKEVERGLHLDCWMRDLNISQRFPGFAVMQEPAWLAWRAPDGEVDEASLVLLRENLLQHTPGEEAVVLATLTQQPLLANAKTLLASRIQASAEKMGISVSRTAREWFAAYCEHVLTPLFALLVEEGIVLLAHQQNIVLRMEDGWPAGMYYRDCQGSGVSDFFFSRHPSVPASIENHWSQQMVNRYFHYYLLVNSTFAVTSAMAADGLIDEETLLHDLRDHLEALCRRLEGDHSCLRHALDSQQLEVKGNFFCYLSGVNEATISDPAKIYLKLDNPLLLRDSSMKREAMA